MAESTLEIVLKARNETGKAMKKLRDALKGINEDTKEIAETEVDDQGFDKLSKSAEKSSQKIEKVGDEIDEINKANPTGTSKFFNSIKAKAEEARKNVEGLRTAFEGVQKVGAGLVKAAVVPAAFSGVAIKQAGDFSIKIAEIGTLVDDATRSTQQLSEDVLTLSDAYGANRFDVANALYQGISAGANAGAEANYLLEEALKGSIAGVTTSTAAIDALTTVANAYGNNLNEVGDIQDTIFTTIAKGKTTYDELARSFANVVPVAAASGVSFQEVSGLLATLTLQGTRTKIATTQIRAAIIGLQNPTKELTALFAQYGGVTKFLRERGLQAAFQVLKDEVGDNNGRLKKLIGTTEGFNAILQATGDTGGRIFQSSMQAIENRTGATDAAMKEVSNTLGKNLEQAFTNVANTLVRVGQALEPIGNAFASAIREASAFISTLIDRFPGITTVIIGTVAALSTLGVLLGSLVAVVGTLGLGFIGLKTGLLAVVTSLGVATEGMTVFRLATVATTTAVKALSIAVLAFVRRAAAALVTTPIGLTLTAAGVAVGFLVSKFNELGKAIEGSEKRSENLKGQMESIISLTKRAEKANAAPETLKQLADLQRLISTGEYTEEQGKVLLGQVTKAVKAAEDLAARRATLEEALFTKQAELQEQRKQKQLEDAEEIHKKVIEDEKAALKVAEDNIKNLTKQKTDALKLLQDIEKGSQDTQEKISGALTDARRGNLSDEAKAELEKRDALKEVSNIRGEVLSLQDAESAKNIQARIAEAAANVENIQSLRQRIELLKTLKNLSEIAEFKGKDFAQKDVAEADKELSEEEQKKAKIKEDLDTLQKQLDELKKPVVIDISVDVAKAKQELDDFLKTLPQQNIDIANDINSAKNNAQIAQGFADGGTVPGGYGGGDRVPAMLEPGEYVIRKERARMYAGLLRQINSGMLSKMKLGGLVPNVSPLRFNSGGAVPSMAGGTPVVLNFGGLGSYNVSADAMTAQKLTTVLQRQALKGGAR